MIEKSLKYISERLVSEPLDQLILDPYHISLVCPAGKLILSLEVIDQVSTSAGDGSYISNSEFLFFLHKELIDESSINFRWQPSELGEKIIVQVGRLYLYLSESGEGLERGNFLSKDGSYIIFWLHFRCVKGISIGSLEPLLFFSSKQTINFERDGFLYELVLEPELHFPIDLTSNSVEYWIIVLEVGCPSEYLWPTTVAWLKQCASQLLWQSCHCSNAGANHFSDFYCFLKVIKLVSFDPPFSHFHKQFRIVISVGKKCLERKTYRLPLLGNLLVANCDCFSS